MDAAPRSMNKQVRIKSAAFGDGEGPGQKDN
jgi:hypothetical protein